MSDQGNQPAVNAEVPPSLVFGKNASKVKSFPVKRPEQEAKESGFTNFQDGITDDYQVGNKHPLKARIDDVNAIGRIASGFHHFRQCGGMISYRQDVASLIKGYPKGAVLEYWDGENYRRVASLVENNFYDFVKNPAYIDGVHWGYADSWSSPYGIFVDPFSHQKIDALKGGHANLDLQWEDETIQNPADQFWRVLNGQYKKSRWIQLTHDSFVIISSTMNKSFSESHDLPFFIYVWAGYRIKESNGRLGTYPYESSEDGDVSQGSLYGLVVARWVRYNTIGAFWPGSTCKYMKAGSMVQLLYLKGLDEVLNITVQIVRLKR